jgi:hypothetical protein
MHAAHDESIVIALTIFLLEVFKCEVRLRSVSQVSELIKEAIIVKSQELLKMIFPLLW